VKKNKKNISKKSITSNTHQSPIAYIKTKMKTLPFYKCYANENWENVKHLTTIVVSREMPSGKICLALYLVDGACLGLKNTTFRFNISKLEFDEFVQEIQRKQGRNFIPIELEDVHNFIFGAIDYAAEYGFDPHSEWAITKYFLDEDLITDGIDEIHFGNEDGKPLYIAGPYDNVKGIIRQLNKVVGKGNYHFVLPVGFSGDVDENDEWYEDDDEDDDIDEEAGEATDYEIIKE
jgi:hypothetical protein